MGFASKVEINGSQYSLASSLYGICTTSSGTPSKIVTCPDFDTLIVGTMIAVKFVYSNTAANPTLNVNGLGALPIYTDGTNAPGVTPQDSWAANSVVTFLYDGSAWLMSDTMGTALAALRTQIQNQMLNMIYPVGSIYMAANETDPGTLFGGTWEQIKDKFLLSAGDTYVNGATGGSATKNLQHAHTTQATTLTQAQIPNYEIGYIPDNVPANHAAWNNGGISGTGRVKTSSQVLPKEATITPSGNQSYGWTIKTNGGGGSHSHGNTGNGLSTTQDIMPPYLAVYVWKRTA